jgi:hypothetical protein
MDSGQVKILTDATTALLPALVRYASIANELPSAEDEALVRQLRVAASALAHALMEVRATSHRRRRSNRSRRT